MPLLPHLVIHDHIQTMEMALYGLTPTDVRRLAYDGDKQVGRKRLAEELFRKTSRPERSSAPRNELIKGCWFQQTENKRVLWDLQID